MLTLKPVLTRKPFLAAVRAERSSGHALHYHCLPAVTGLGAVIAVRQGIPWSKLLKKRCFQQSSIPSGDLQTAQVTSAPCFFLSYFCKCIFITLPLLNSSFPHSGCKSRSDEDRKMLNSWKQVSDSQDSQCLEQVIEMGKN